MNEKGLSLKEAEGLAREAFRHRFKERPVPQEIVGNLYREALVEKGCWRFKVYLSLPQPYPLSDGLLRDLDPSNLPPVLMAQIDVDRLTGKVSLTESSDIVW